MVTSELTQKREAQLAEAERVYKTAPEYSSIRKTAACFELVTPTSLQNRIKHGINKVHDIESRQHLTDNESKYLFEICDRMSSHNFAVTIPIFREYANGILRQKTRDKRASVGKNWTSEHFQKWKHVYQTVHAKHLHHARAAANNDNNLYNDYFDKLHTAITMYKIKGRNFYNLDEKGFRLGEAALSKVIIHRGCPEQAEVAEDGSKEMVTVLECISTDEYVARPLIIYKGKNHNFGWSRRDSKNYIFAYSESGWIDSELYSDWIKTVFEPDTSERANGSWRLLLVDGLAAHMNLEIVEFCWNHKIIVLCLPSHATHLLQPLDVGVFRHYQHWYGMEVQEHSRHGKTGIGKHNFMDFLEPARQKTFGALSVEGGSGSSSICSRAFALAGAWPVDPKAATRRIPEPVPPAWSPTVWDQPLDDAYRIGRDYLNNYTRTSSHQTPIHADSSMLLNLFEQMHSEVERLRAENSFLTYEKEKTQKELERIRTSKPNRKRIFTESRLCTGEYIETQKRKRELQESVNTVTGKENEISGRKRARRSGNLKGRQVAEASQNSVVPLQQLELPVSRFNEWPNSPEGISGIGPEAELM